MGRKGKKQPTKKPRRKKPPKRKRETSNAKSGLSFEIRAARALAQIKPELEVTHNQQLMTEPGASRQFDVTGRVAGLLTHTYEARERTRKTDTPQLEGFQTKNATLIEKPKVAGIVSSSGFYEPPITWVRHYRDAMLVQELYQLRAAVPEDWAGDIRELHLQLEGHSLKTKTVKLLYRDLVPANTTTTIVLTTGRLAAFVRDKFGSVTDNLLDLVNREMRDAQKTGALGPRIVNLPVGSFVTLGGTTREVSGLEVEYEGITISSTMTIDHSGRFPDTIIDAINNRRTLIEDPNRAIKASRHGIDLKLEFTDAQSMQNLLNLDDLLPAPTPTIPGIPSGINDRMAHLSTQVGLRMLRAGKKNDVIPPNLQAILTQAAIAFEEARHDEAERLYKESLLSGTALAALCNLAYIAGARDEYDLAIHYSIVAIKTFPLEAEGFVNLVSALLAVGRLHDARQVLDTARPLHGMSFQMRRREAEVLFAEGKFNTAAEIFYELALDDDDAALLANLARCEHALEEHDGAAWDAYRAWRKAPVDLGLGEMAMAFSAFANDHPRVLEIAQELEVNNATLPPHTARRALAAAIQLDDTHQALHWLLKVPRDAWDVTELTIHAQLCMRKNDTDAATESIRSALNLSPSSNDIRLALAAIAERLTLPTDVLVALAGVQHRTAPRMRALAHAILGDVPAVIDDVSGIARDEAIRVVRDCMHRCPKQTVAECTVVTALAEWFATQESSEHPIVVQQAATLAGIACARRDVAAAQHALQLIARARAVVDPPELRIAEIVALTGSGRRTEAARLLDTLTAPDHDADVLGAAVDVTFRCAAADIAGKLAEAFVRSGKEPATVSSGRVIALGVISTFICGRPLETTHSLAAHRAFSQDSEGLLAAALIAYSNAQLDECARSVAPLVKGPRVMGEAILLNMQCLAEQGEFAKLLALAEIFTPQLRQAVLWASKRETAQRCPVAPPIASMPLMDSHLADAEFMAIAKLGDAMYIQVCLDWGAALSGMASEVPTCEALWIVRLGHPRGFLQRLFRNQAEPASASTSQP